MNISILLYGLTGIIYSLIMDELVKIHKNDNTYQMPGSLRVLMVFLWPVFLIQFIYYWIKGFIDGSK